LKQPPTLARHIAEDYSAGMQSPNEGRNRSVRDGFVSEFPLQCPSNVSDASIPVEEPHQPILMVSKLKVLSVERVFNDPAYLTPQAKLLNLEVAPHPKWQDRISLSVVTSRDHLASDAF